MKKVLIAIMLIIPLLLVRCIFGEDDATHLAYQLEKAAGELAKSGSDQLTIHYQPLDGIDQVYSVELVERGPIWIGKNGKPQSSTTTYHLRFVSVPKGLKVAKNNSETILILRKNGRRIEVVEIR